ncbi:MAG: polymorphic toxin-type HINT domain-containing protein [Thainema sp.]
MKWFQIGLIILLSIFVLNTDVAYARGGCFSGDTQILTVNGYKSIEQLNQTDHILGFDFSNHQIKEEEIGEIQIFNSPDYYLINDRIKVTGTHPFYVQKNEKIELTEVQNLSIGDHLLGESNTRISISEIEHIQQPITVYNLLSVKPDHNFYADGVLVHNKGGGGGGSGGGGHGHVAGGADYEPVPLNAKTIPSLIKIFVVFIPLILPFGFLQEIYNFIRFRDSHFTEDEDLIEFARQVNILFRNRYSVRYFQDDQYWIMIPIASELDEEEYQDCISKSELIEKVHNLFIQYQNDWTNKNFEAMTKYIAQPFYQEQCDTFTKSFGNDFDIVYKPNVLDVAPLEYQQENDKAIFQIQINAEMINFDLSDEGYVLNGEPYSRSCTEFWTVGVDSEKNLELIYITQVDAIAFFEKV